VPDSLLALLIQTGLISITEDEIMDRSKIDPLAKIIVLCQTLWFIAQSVARGIEGLSITNLEILTNAFAVLNFFTYFLWWNKPQRVRFPIIIDASGTEEANLGMERRIQCILKAISEEFKNDWEGMQIPFDKLHIPQWFIIRACLYPFLTIFNQLVQLTGGGIHYQTGSNEWNRTGLVVLFSITVVFGGIHCIPWGFQFPSHAEQILWRGCAFLVTSIPIGMTLMVVLVMLKDLEDTPFHTLIYVVPPALYIMARIILIVLAFTELRALPSSAYQTVEWTTLIPHI
jgi:hypothetical protein